MQAPRFPIGERLRHAREQRGLSLAAVAERTGLSKGFLSRVERDGVSPSIDSLVAIADAVGLAVADVFAVAPVVVSRSVDRFPDGLPGEGVRDTLLSPPDDRRVTVLETVAAPGGSGGDELYHLPSQVELCYVVAGRIELVFASECYTLDAGDSATFAADAAHTWRNLGDGEARVLWVLAPALRDPWTAKERRDDGSVADVQGERV
ncbi:transcriptional regulator, XRE family [Acidimicrobium ferrooxidans DSM 10331]|uniref:Transcriptional regulator, XRE family n=1 Tax=Acidimicrobium ferrooxidans (strain DSM 10331 / JCM 15462 / NBRC 103882 / ICP) TaxID=525909 RepID=C7M2J9_ACIFD|nr:helix-turn-helix domain-containing protein [Acidimicrobium ferrooxidans]ACU53243.1 transcriptional regulator, XRE family [Acidimicrobium ferrooxidans DSM 10331]